jgi:hypothetical protein
MSLKILKFSNRPSVFSPFPEQSTLGLTFITRQDG